MKSIQEQGSANYGSGDATFQAAGGEAGIKDLVNSFYDIMATREPYQRIHSWHPDDALARDKLYRFLCGWMGGPRRYQEKYGGISIPQVHAHLDIGEAERDAWLGCMREALARQDYPQSLRDYLIQQFAMPAEMIRRTCSERRE